MSRSGFFRSVYSFITSAGVIATGTAAATIYFDKKYEGRHGHHHPFVQKFHNYTSPHFLNTSLSPNIVKEEMDDLPYHLLENGDASIHLKALLFSCKLSGTRLSSFVISILDNKDPIEKLLMTLEDDNELAKSEIKLYESNTATSSLNLAHIAAMSNRNLEEKARLVEFLQQAGVDIDKKGPVGEKLHDICPSLFLPSLLMPKTIIDKPKSENQKRNSYSRYT